MAPEIRLYLSRAVATETGIKLVGALNRRSYSRVAKTLEKAGCVLNRPKQVFEHPTKYSAEVLAELLRE